MKILFLSDVFFPRVNGVSTSISIFMEDLIKLGHKVHLIAPKYYGESNTRNITRIESKKVFFDPEDHLMSLKTLNKKIKWIKKQKFDIIHIHTPFVAHFFGKKLSKKLGIPIIETYHTSFEDYLHLYVPFIPEFLARKLSRFIAKSLCNGVDALISPSEQLKTTLRSYNINKPIETIPTGLSKRSYIEKNPHFFRDNYNIKPNDNLLLYVGRVAHEKNIDFLISSFVHIYQKQKNTKLLITGEGPALEHISGLIRKFKMENNIILTGYLERNNELLSCYAASDLFVFSSKTETQGLVLIEAMAQGLPVAALSINGTESILKNNLGAITPKDNVYDFAEKCLELLNDKKRLKIMSLEAKKNALINWTSEKQAKKLADLYKEVSRKLNFSGLDKEDVFLQN
jgi:glycosyltransferase involved in cell wall biosynthesis